MSANGSLDNISPIIGELIALKNQLKELEEKKKALEAQVRPVLNDRGALEFDGFIVKCETMPGRKTLDKKAVEAVLAAEGYDLDDFYKVGAPYTQLTIK